MMPKKTISAVLVLVMLLSVFSSCSIGGNEELVIYFPVSDNIRSVDPQIVSGMTATMIAVNCYEGLVGVDAQGNIVPAVAERWECPDGLNYTFYLREDAVWYLTDTAKKALAGKISENFDTRVTAKDFVFAFRRALTPNTASPEASLLGCIKNARQALAGLAAADTVGVSAQGDYVLKIQLEAANPDFLGLLTKPLCMPCNEEFFTACGGRYGLDFKYLMTNGAFFLTRWNDNSSFRISRSDEYIGTRTASPAAVWFYINRDSADIAAKLSDDVYQAAYLDSENVGAVKSGKLSINTFSPAVYSFCFNTSSGLCTDADIRKALLRSVDVSLFSEEGKTSAVSIIPDMCRASFPEYATPSAFLAFDEQQAKTALAAALERLEISKAEIELLCLSEHETAVKKQLQLWQATLGVGMTVSIKALPYDELISAVKKGNYSFALCPLFAKGSDPASFFTGFTSSDSDDILSLVNPEYDAVAQQVIFAQSEQELAAACATAEGWLYENAVVLPVWGITEALAMREDISGIYFYSSVNQTYFIDAQ